MPQFHQVHHHQVWVKARVSLAWRPTKFASWRLQVVRSEGSEIPRSLFLYHGNTFLRVKLKELVIKLSDIIVESDMPTNEFDEKLSGMKLKTFTCQHIQCSRGSGKAMETEVG